MTDERLIWIFAFFLIGSILGSFFNVVGLRIPNNESIVKPGSHCPKCGHNLKWYELIPIFSYLILGGRCYNCKTKISVIYPFIEIFTGVLYAVSFYSFGFTPELMISLVLSSLLVLIIVSDVTYLIIPDGFIIIASVLILLIKVFCFGIENALMSLLYAVVSFSILYLIMLLGNWMFKRESLGGADIKLFFVVGLIFNPLMSMIVLLIACIIALPISIILLLKNRENVIPFGPFIALSYMFLFFLKVDYTKIIEILKNL